MVLRKKFCLTALLVLAVCLTLPSAAVEAFEAVTNITGVPSTVRVGVVTLSGTVIPANATYRDIVWSVSDQGATGAYISNNVLSTAAAGTVTVQGTIVNGVSATPNIDFTQHFTITVCTPPIIRTNSLPTGYLGWYYSETLDVEGSQPIALTIVSGRTLPRGLGLHQSGVISGVPDLTGTYTFTVRAENAVDHDEKKFTITIRENYLWDSGCNVSVGCATAVTLILGISAAVRHRKKSIKKV